MNISKYHLHQQKINLQSNFIKNIILCSLWIRIQIFLTIIFNFFLKFLSRDLLLIMKITKSINNLIKQIDLFSTSQFLRFHGDGDYKTFSGGICSLIVMVVFVALFINTALQTINMEIINWSGSNQLLFDPSQTIVKTNANIPFMFGIKLLGFNLNVGERIFDIFMVERSFQNGLIQTKTKIVDLVPCTNQHFNVNSQISSYVQQMQFQKWLCPPIDYFFSLKGKFSSASANLLQIRLQKCNQSLNSSRPCASNQTVNFYEKLFDQFILNFIYINPLINPGNQNYLSYYIEDLSYIKFTTKLGNQGMLFIQDYTITTDTSLLPLTTNTVDQGIIVPNNFQIMGYQVTKDIYASFVLMKSANTINYIRSFNKLDVFFSYIGGLIGMILAFMFAVSNFTNMAFQLDISEKLCTYQDNQPNDFRRFNLLTYILFTISRILQYFNFCKDWKSMIQYFQCKQQTNKQLDINLILTKLIFFERSVEAILDPHQIEGLHLQKQQTLEKIKKRRKRYNKKQRNQINEIQIAQLSSSYSSIQLYDSKNPHQKVQFQQSSIAIQNQRDANNVITVNSNQVVRKKQDYDQLYIIEMLKKQSMMGNGISKRILQGIGIKIQDQNQIKQVLKIEVNKLEQFQFIS